MGNLTSYIMVFVEQLYVIISNNPFLYKDIMWSVTKYGYNIVSCLMCRACVVLFTVLQTSVLLLTAQLQNRTMSYC